MKPPAGHRPLCTLELIAEGRAERCPGAACGFWERGCVLERIEAELAWRPEVAQLLLDLRRALEAGRTLEVEHARSLLARALVTDEHAPGAS